MTLRLFSKKASSKTLQKDVRSLPGAITFQILFADVNISEKVAEASFLLLKKGIEENSVILHSISDVRRNGTFQQGKFLAIFPRY